MSWSRILNTVLFSIKNNGFFFRTNFNTHSSEKLNYDVGQGYYVSFVTNSIKYFGLIILFVLNKYEYNEYVRRQGQSFYLSWERKLEQKNILLILEF